MRGQRTVEWFARHMMQKLAENEHKPHWSGVGFGFLFRRLHDETEELLEAVAMFDAMIKSGDRMTMTTGVARDAIRECADVANFAMMIADRIATKAAEHPPHGHTAEQVRAVLWHKGAE